MAYITDPELLAQLEGGASIGAPDKQQEEESTDWGIYSKPEGSIVDTTQAGYKRLWENFLASSTNDPELSRFQLGRAKAASADFKEKSSKLGVAGNVIAGIGTYAPVVAGTVLNPVVGGGAMAAMGTADTLATQQEEGQDYDWQSAGLAGAGQAALEMATGGVARPIAGNIARNLSSPLAKKAVDVGVVSLAQPAVSNTGAQMMTNLASGRDIMQDTGMAAAIGGGTGGAFRGLHGAAKMLGSPVNERGQASIEQTTKINKDSTAPINDQFATQAFEYNNLSKDIDNQLANPDESGMSFNELAEAKTNLDANYGGAAALQDAVAVIKDRGFDITPNAFDYRTTNDIFGNGQQFHVAEDILGHKPSRAEKAGESLQGTPPPFLWRGSAKRAAETTDSLLRRNKDKYDDAFREIRGYMGDNLNTVDNAYRVAKQDLESTGVGADQVRSLADLKADLKSYNQAFGLVGTKSAETLDTLQSLARRITEKSHELGLSDQFKGIDGKAGSFSPLKTYRSFDDFNKTMKTMWPAIEQTTIDPNRTPFSDTTAGGIAIDTALTLGLSPLAAVGRRAFKEANRQLGRRRLSKTKKGGAEDVARLAARPSESIPTAPENNPGLRAGSIPDAAVDANAALNEMGISTGESPTPVINQADVQSPIASPEIDPWTNQPRGNAESAAAMAQGNRLRMEEEARLAKEAEPIVPQEPEAVLDVQRTAPVDAGKLAAVPDRSLSNPETVQPIVETAPLVAEEPIAARTEAPRGNMERAAAFAKQLQKALSKAPEATETADPWKPKVNKSKDLSGTPKKIAKEVEEAKQEPTKAIVEEHVPEPTKKIEKVDTEFKPREKFTFQKLDSEIQSLSNVNKSNTSSNELPKLRAKRSNLLEEKRELDSLVKMATNKDAQVSQNHRDSISPDEVRGLIESAGGLRGLYDYGKSPAEGLNTLIRGYNDSLRVEAKENSKKAVTEVDKVVDDLMDSHLKSKEASQQISKKHHDIDGELKSKGFTDEEIAQAKKDAGVKEGEDFNPRLVANYAKTNAKIAADKAEAEVRQIKKEESEKLAAEKDLAKKKAALKPSDSKKPTIRDSLKRLNTIVESVNMSGNPDVRDIVKKAVLGRKAPLTEGQMNAVLNRISDYLKKEKEMYKKAIEQNPKIEQPVELGNHLKDADYKRRVSEQKRSIAEMEKKAEDLKKAEDGLADVAARDAKIDSDNKAKAARKIEALEMADKARELTKERLDQAERRLKLSREKLEKAEELAKEVKDDVGVEISASQIKDAIEARLNEVFKDLKPAQAKALAKEISVDIPIKTSVTSPEFVKWEAMSKMGEDFLEASGDSASAKAVRTSREELTKSLERRAEFPNNRDLWMSYESLTKIRKDLKERPGSDQASSYLGDLGKRMRLAIFGNVGDEVYNKHVVYGDNVIKKLIEEGKTGAEHEGKGFTVSDEIKEKSKAVIKRK